MYKNKLENRYRTYFMNPIVLYYHNIKENDRYHKEMIKDILKPYRVKNNEDHLSEFARLSLVDLIEEVEKYLDYA